MAGERLVEHEETKHSTHQSRERGRGLNMESLSALTEQLVSAGLLWSRQERTRQCL
jgi:hypothetical protein